MYDKIDKMICVCHVNRLNSVENIDVFNNIVVDAVVGSLLLLKRTKVEEKMHRLRY